ncbi:MULTISPECIES: WXG100 family type VII secretion target [unclassified Streptomyces]|uniref:WXG100 family type VII secretion target n=1 Tax=unclassified Streptomyces TaxID=2593676 RepID=UPI00226F7248|nr:MULTISPECIES: WXG100 family type VII secretion target [unclassified Streptomyces]MCY0960241.1 WXG100 family type VII secretion target [Streptomyces sp. H27-H5]
MAGEPTSVSIAGMRSAAGSFQSALEDANSTYTQMQGQIDALRGSWSGDASSTFQGAMDTWLQDFASVRQQLSLMLEKLQANTGSYKTTHQATTDAANQLHKSMVTPLPGF